MSERKGRFTIEQMLEMIDEPNRSACFKIQSDNKYLFQKAQGSSHNHQAWEGGYLDHLTEAMNSAILVYDAFNSARPLDFSLSDVLTVVYLHDIEKPWKYNVTSEGKLVYKSELDTKLSQHEFRTNVLNKYGIVLTPEMENGMKYAEGEGNDYSRTERKMLPLASIVHMADTASARLWPNYPLKENDPWEPVKTI